MPRKIARSNGPSLLFLFSRWCQRQALLLFSPLPPLLRLFLFPSRSTSPVSVEHWKSGGWRTVGSGICRTKSSSRASTINSLSPRPLTRPRSSVVVALSSFSIYIELIISFRATTNTYARNAATSSARSRMSRRRTMKKAMMIHRRLPSKVCVSTGISIRIMRIHTSKLYGRGTQRRCSFISRRRVGCWLITSIPRRQIVAYVCNRRSEFRMYKTFLLPNSK